MNPASARLFARREHFLFGGATGQDIFNVSESRKNFKAYLDGLQESASYGAPPEHQEALESNQRHFNFLDRGDEVDMA